MIKQLKMGFKMLRYAHGIKTCVMWMVVVLLFGMLLEWSASGENVFLNQMGLYFVMMIAIWPHQLLVSLNVPKVVAASPWKKKIQTSVMALVSCVAFLFAYILVIVIEAVKLAKQMTLEEDFTFFVIWAAVFAGVLMVYMAFSAKYFVVSTIGFVFFMQVLSCVVSIRTYTDIAIFHMSMHPALTILTGALIIVAGGLLEYGVSLLLYKVPVSKYAQMNSLRKKM